MKRNVALLTFMILLLLGDTMFGYLLLRGRICPVSLQAWNIGVPIITQEPISDNYMTIKQMVTSNDTLYILYKNHCIVSAYSHKGDYLYTISVYSHKNGSAKIAVSDNKLYLLDKYENLYVFDNDKFLYFVESNNTKSLLTSVNFNEACELFYVDGCSVFTHSSNGQPKIVIARPWYLIFTQQHIFNFILFILNGAFILSYHLCSRRTTQGQGQGDGSVVPTDES